MSRDGAGLDADDVPSSLTARFAATTVPDFSTLPLLANIAIFAAGSGAIWLAGARLARCADVVAERTGIGHVFMGALFLGGITSLPEGGTTVAASMIGNAPLAVNNLLGGVATQLTLLAVADAVIPGRPLSARIHDPVVVLEGGLLIFLLGLVTAGLVVGDHLVLGVDVWTSAILLAVLLAFYLVHHHRSHPTCRPPRAWARTRRERALARFIAGSYGMARFEHVTGAGTPKPSATRRPG